MNDTDNSAPPANHQSNVKNLTYTTDTSLPAPPSSHTSIEELYQHHINDLQEQYDNTWKINFIKRWWLEEQMQYLQNAKQTCHNNPIMTLNDARQDINNCINWGSCW